MTYYIGVFVFFIIPVALSLAISCLLLQIKPLRKAFAKWLES